MTVSDSLDLRSLARAKLVFFPILALQLVLAVLVAVGLFHLGLWKSGVLEICKIGFVLPQAFRLRRASLEHDTVLHAASLLATAAALLPGLSAFADAVLISYDVQSGAGH